MTYVMTDDPNDPCSLCVMWEETEPNSWEDAIPWAAPGRKADRIYKAVHDDCERAAIQYTTEASCEMDGHRPCVCGARDRWEATKRANR